MYQSLVDKKTGTVFQLVEGDSSVRFEVHENFSWVDGPYTIEEGTDAADYWYYENDREVRLLTFKEPSYDLSRRMAYGSIQTQFDMLFHDMNNGLIPGKENSTWFSHINSIKEQYQKP